MTVTVWPGDEVDVPVPIALDVDFSTYTVEVSLGAWETVPGQWFAPHSKTFAADGKSAVAKIRVGAGFLLPTANTYFPWWRVKDLAGNVVGIDHYLSRVVVKDTTGTPIGTQSFVESVVAGTNVTVDDSDPRNPIVSSTGGGGGDVQTVAGVSPDGAGNVPLTAANVGADTSGAAATAQAAAIAAAASDATTKANAAQSAATSAASTDATTKANAAQAAATSAAATDATSKVAAEATARNTAIATQHTADVAAFDATGAASAAQAAAISTAATDATTKANAAQAASQPLDADLTTIAALDATTAGALATDGAGWIRKTYAQLKTALGLGTAATKDVGTSPGTVAAGDDGRFAQINGVAVTGTPSAGQIPTATSPTAATWQTPGTPSTPAQIRAAMRAGGPGIYANGILAPAGSLENWYAARDASNTSLCEVVAYGDSTFFGFTGDGLNNYSIIETIRLAIRDSGFRDGGHGVAHTTDTPGTANGDGFMPVAERGISLADATSTWVMEQSSMRSLTAGDTAIYQGRGSKVRLLSRRDATTGIASSYNIAIDNAAAVEIDPLDNNAPNTNPLTPSVAPNGFTKFLSLPGSFDGLHSVRFTNLLTHPYVGPFIAASAAGGGGATSGALYYQVTAVTAAGESLVGPTHTTAIVGTFGSVALTIRNPNPLPVSYNVYRSSTGAAGSFTKANAGVITVSGVAGANTSYTDPLTLIGGANPPSTSTAGTAAAGESNTVIDFLYDDGIVIHKQAIAGVQSLTWFGRGERSMSWSLGVDERQDKFVGMVYNPKSTVTSDRHVSLGIINVGLNDYALSGGAAVLQQNLSRGVQAIRAAGGDAVICVPNFSLYGSTSPNTQAGDYYAAVASVAQAMSVPLIDLSTVLGPANVAVTNGYAVNGNVHLLAPGYRVQAARLWSLLGADDRAAAVPGQPKDLVATPSGTTSANLTWRAAPSTAQALLTDYLVEFRTSPAGAWTPVTRTPSTTCTQRVTGFSAATAYDFRVTGINSVGNGTTSAAVTATTPATGAVMITDSFTRADSNVLGYADGGTRPAFWRSNLLSEYGITSNQLAVKARPATESYTFIDTGLCDCTLEVDSVVMGGGSLDWVIFRLDETANNGSALALVTGSLVSLTNLNAGTATASTTVASLSSSLAAGDHITVIMNGTSIIVKKGASTVLTTTSSVNTTATKHGIRGQFATSRWDNFSIKA